ncbi:MAG: hypothetical protein LUF92_16725 [Clostridiales bacterium]|nr:hypothetical protein [Clostridiales bacterium]
MLDEDDEDQVSEFTAEGHFASNQRQSLLQVAVALLDGTNSQGYVLISDTIFQYTTSNSWEYHYRDEYFNADDDGIGSALIAENCVIDVVAGNFDGNYEGKKSTRSRNRNH